ncbi:protein HsdA [Pasteurella multocida]|nr:protein HsdA [Pasteurella multocida]
MKKLTTCQLGDLIEFKNGKAIKPNNGIVPIYGGNGILGYSSEFNAERSLIVGRVGAYCGSVFFEKKKFWVSDNAILGVPKNSINAEYAYYLLKQLDLNSKHVGSSQPLLTQGILNSLKVSIYKDLLTQQKIAQVLSTLDRKIALNQQINAELEKMAKTLYDYWFVQFDFPDENGNPYKSSGGEMVYNPELKRDVPKGWEVKKLGEIADLYQPKTLSENELLENGKYLVYGANGIIGRYDEFNHEQSVVAIACRGNSCGTINITQPFSWITGNAMVVKPKENNVSVDFIKNLLAISNIEKCISGSAQPQITRTNLSPLLMVYPPKDMLEKYSEITHKYFNQRINTLHQNTQLTQLRDFLLPMLMNGQVEVDSLDFASN